MQGKETVKGCNCRRHKYDLLDPEAAQDLGTSVLLLNWTLSVYGDRPAFTTALQAKVVLRLVRHGIASKTA